MNTPICDFVRDYAAEKQLRLHMPGHKGTDFLGFESLDITEIDGADSLYEASGIIRQSEENASSLFGCPTFYSTEGSSLCIRAMLYLCALYARQTGRPLRIAAGRNAHKTLLTAAALMDLDITWLYPAAGSSYLSCKLDAAALDAQLAQMDEKPLAVYLTSPDYLGNVNDIRAIADVCHRHGCLLLVDNAHGAYLKFLAPSQHPIDLGADICCDSAHKTLPVLTGGAYLHIAPNAPAIFTQKAKDALAMFGSTSPSYLILQSLDAANRYLADGYSDKLFSFAAAVAALKADLTAHGYSLIGDEPMKLTVSAKPYGYSGKELAVLLLNQNIVCEFADPDFTVCMFTPENGSEALELLKNVLLSIPKRPPISASAPVYSPPKQAMTICEAAFANSETVTPAQSLGRIFAGTGIGCPPAVPIVVCGEVIDPAAVDRLLYYGVENIAVVTEN
ncbi:MAG: PLP-dependent transferase [Oscillospiraceae bacterium]|nr:PLP-dependent transferase [Oscillospiraceae bacterium]